MRTASTAFVIAALLAAGCTSQADLAYTPPAGHAFVPHPVIADIHVTDERGAADPRWVGAVMGYDGKPLKRIETPGPAADSVAQALRIALTARGDLAPPGYGRVDLEVTIRALAAEQWAERQGVTDLELRLVDRATGREVYSARAAVESRGDNYLAIDNFLFGSPSALARINDALLGKAIDGTFDSGGFVTALR